MLLRTSFRPSCPAQGVFDTPVLAFLGICVTTIGYSLQNIGWHSTLAYYLAVGGAVTLANIWAYRVEHRKRKLNLPS